MHRIIIIYYLIQFTTKTQMFFLLVWLHFVKNFNQTLKQTSNQCLINLDLIEKTNTIALIANTQPELRCLTPLALERNFLVFNVWLNDA